MRTPTSALTLTLLAALALTGCSATQQTPQAPTSSASASTASAAATAAPATSDDKPTSGSSKTATKESTARGTAPASNAATGTAKPAPTGTVATAEQTSTDDEEQGTRLESDEKDASGEAQQPAVATPGGNSNVVDKGDFEEYYDVESEIVWKSCEEAAAEGVTDILEGTAGYRVELDPDENGIACEK